MIYRAACMEDIEFLVQARLDFIKVDPSEDNYEFIRNNCYQYFGTSLKQNSCDIILAEEEGKCIGTGIVFYYLSVPSAFNMTGKNAYITSLYVNHDYRKRGIGTTILKELIQYTKLRGHQIIMLNASEMGRPMYNKMGFVETQNGMLLDIRMRENKYG